MYLRSGCGEIIAVRASALIEIDRWYSGSIRGEEIKLRGAGGGGRREGTDKKIG